MKRPGHTERSRSLRPGAVLNLVLIAALLALAACGGQSQGDAATPTATAATQSGASSEAWDELLDQAFALEDENTALQAEMNSGLQEFSAKLADASGSETITSALGLLDDIQAGYGEVKENHAALAALWGEMASLDVSEAQSTYAGQQKRIAELGVKLDDLFNDWLDKERDLINAINEATTSGEAEDAANKLMTLMRVFATKVSNLGTRIEGLKQESDRYYKQNVSQ